MKEPAPGKLSIGPLQIFGWILGGLSVLNLVNDLGRVALYGRLKAWAEAYSLFVHKTGGFLFGWIQFHWFKVSPEELHLLVIGLVLATANFRSEYAFERAVKAEDPFVRAAAPGCLLMILLPLAAVILLPVKWSLIAVIPWLVLLTLSFATNKSDLTSGSNVAPGYFMRRELIGVGAVFLLLIALNYLFFRTDGG